MKRCLIWISLSMAGAFVGVGCGPKPPEVTDTADAAAARRVELFGPRAAAPEIVWRSSGLGIRIVKEGDGAAPAMTDTVRVHYVGTLKDGTVFDSSRERGQPEDFVVNRLIPGWAAAMPALKAGGQAEFFIPPLLGYRHVKVGNVPPNSGLIFEVELIAVNPTAPR
ncbi:MAG TPA: FKBP-type peptidyl-prolyl cis-trans isomerase [Opitutus sp.]|nr:FKBP-type peptidyl-prolyl cis-trans isomerase [Opitutus sp.]